MAEVVRTAALPHHGEMDIENAVQAVLARYPKLEVAILFGSAASGRMTQDSDIDLAVAARHSLSADEKIALIGEIAESTGRAVDLIDLKTAGEPLLGHILHTGRRLRGSNAAFAELVSRHLLDAADFLPYVDRMLQDRRRAWLG